MMEYAQEFCHGGKRVDSLFIFGGSDEVDPERPDLLFYFVCLFVLLCADLFCADGGGR